MSSCSVAENLASDDFVDFIVNLLKRINRKGVTCDNWQDHMSAVFRWRRPFDATVLRDAGFYHLSMNSRLTTFKVSCPELTKTFLRTCI